ncbi:MAG: hypothetical protein OEV31_05475 [Gammaproteobacteria bacterium]|nr:hypothetical protein [Gammaproteobacteria bacterium]
MSAEASVPLPQGRLSGRSVFVQAVRDALQAAAREGWHELILSDANFSDWPLGERAVAETLQQWARGGRRFTMLAMDYSGIPRQHARFAKWRQTWDHIIECRVCKNGDPLAFPSVLWSPAWVMQRIDVERDVLICDAAAARRVELRQVLDECRRDSAPGFSASVLGL